MLIQLSPTEVLWKDHLCERIFPCSVGFNGFISSEKKQEGDKSTPLGHYFFKQIFYRPDKISLRKNIRLPIHPITKNSFWCDDSTHPLYNQYCDSKIGMSSYEELWRDDSLYDLFITTNHNQDPSVPNKGSAIFIHCSKAIKPPLEQSLGCLKLLKEDILWLVERITNDDSWLLPKSLVEN